ncbi:Coenzyme F420 hydrogenase/dehydrogenase, beta subunit C-terminal domain [Phocaeicola dorei]|nr:Coenzyme F420 hydrogenase/dehydrogenase, beta subunit C-terminal domain [Phocaeicola dorei]
MQPDSLGFLYPFVEQSKCIHCGLCEKICSFNKDYDISQNLYSPQAYGARHKDIKEVETSRSGAVFIALSDWVLQQGGVVYGAGYTDHFRVVHKRAITRELRNEFKGSKYVQSDLSGVFNQVKQDLKSGKIVLFSGTPCQTAGLNSYIGKKLRGNLYLMDIVCHGVPSPYIWRDFLNYIEKKNGDIVTSVDFRDKQRFGWKDHRESYKFSKGNTVSLTLYTELFYKNIMSRPSCSVCYYANIKRPSDITIGDFWGWEKTDPKINKDDKGVSLILVNTSKGGQLFEVVKDDLYVLPAKLEDCIQPNLMRPTPAHLNSNQFRIDYSQKGWEYVMKKYYPVSSFTQRLIGKIKKMIKSLLNFKTINVI